MGSPPWTTGNKKYIVARDYQALRKVQGQHFRTVEMLGKELMYKKNNAHQK
jgi:hypothetical protein